MPVIKSSTFPTGNLKGEDHGATISLILDDSLPGHGPRLHRHPYDETWIVLDGNLTLQSGEERLSAGRPARTRRLRNSNRALERNDGQA
jgi:quercetin dioxygenase-like cupin family protein